MIALLTQWFQSLLYKPIYPINGDMQTKSSYRNCHQKTIQVSELLVVVQDHLQVSHSVSRIDRLESPVPPLEPYNPGRQVCFQRGSTTLPSVGDHNRFFHHCSAPLYLTLPLCRSLSLSPSVARSLFLSLSTARMGSGGCFYGLKALNTPSNSLFISFFY
ncbi:hypothetical protein Hanom_Chr08g00757001 [Helianthus anomalus]